jgi:hypothetical protein
MEVRIATPSDALRFLRYAYLGVIGLVVLLALFVETVFPSPVQETPFIVNALYTVGMFDVVIALWYRRKFSGSTAEALRVNPADSLALANWLKGQMVPLPMALGIGVMGLAVRISGATTLRAAPLYIAAILLLLALRPSGLPEANS